MIEVTNQKLASLAGATVLGSLREPSEREGYERIFIAFTGGLVLSVRVQAQEPKRNMAVEIVDRVSETGAVDVPSNGRTKDYERSFVDAYTATDEIYGLLAGNYDANAVHLYEMNDKSYRMWYFDNLGPGFKRWYKGLEKATASPAQKRSKKEHPKSSLLC
jgi:hypothetical protein